jgi:NAD(P)-dependent dehydrogenase (short-subunit alcohol dehydrogenase family)
MHNYAQHSGYAAPPLAFDLKVALVTGASSGFGLLISLTLAQKGYRIIATMRDIHKHELLMDKARKAKVDMYIDCMELDVTNPIAVSQTIREVIGKYKNINVLVNNAGYAVGGFVEDVPLEEWRRQMETNFFGLVAVTKEVLPYMREQGSGLIINISSISGQVGFPGYAPYVASKFAVEGFSEALRLEMKPFGVHVSLVEPGAYPTHIWQKGFDSLHTPEQSPYYRMLQAILSYSRRSLSKAANPQDVADIVAHICCVRNPKLRYSLGRGVSLLLWTKRLLPYSLLERIMLNVLKDNKKVTPINSKSQ